MLDRKYLRLILSLLALVASSSTLSQAQSAKAEGSLSLLGDWISESRLEGGFALADGKRLATVVVSQGDHAVVRLAAEDLVEDLERVTGKKASLAQDFEPNKGGQVIIGTLGESDAVAALLARSSVELGDLQGAWESFVVAVVGEGKKANLLIVGSDRRGTAYGAYELSQAIGVSPWHWWADSAVRKSKSLYVSKNTRRFGPPSVKYRGIFINDEDWGLQPWAAHTFDPELGDIGPKTYEKVFELMLRLKANTLWPAMHEVTKAFNLYPENKELADRYAIVMASSHAEPMLRNNVTEWTAPKGHFNYQTHPDLVKDYWEKRLVENGRFENVYTLGMRGIHDSGMTGGGSKEDKIDLLEQVIADQRELLREHVSEDLESVAQVFTPYKEVLELYEGGMEVPEDVTIVWPDDNHGYLRRFPNDVERSRKGGSGVYYHISYLGAPLAYLWLDTTPLALVWEEMHRSFELGSRDYWILNVGDIKSQERGTEFFLSMAWDIERWGLDAQSAFLTAWAAREFGRDLAAEVAGLMSEYYVLNFQRRPEHLQWWMPYTRVKTSPLTEAELQQRLSRMLAMIERCEELQSRLPQERYDSFFQLVAYPVKASAYANLRYFHLEQYHRLFHADPPMARKHGGLGRAADELLVSLTREYNHEIADGKWFGMMAEEPADSAWRSFRTTPWVLPAEGMVEKVDELQQAFAAVRFQGARASVDAHAEILREAEAFDRRGGEGGQWESVQELGWSGDGIRVFPATLKSLSPEEIDASTPWVEYEVETRQAGDYRLFLELLPTFPSEESGELQFAVSVNDGELKPVSISRKSKTQDWSKGVLEGSIGVELAVDFAHAGSNRIRIYMMDTGVVLDRFFLHQGELAPSFSGPASLR
ncbi:glycosyl hydrolase 115 family protein [Pelagicoccus sp. NFK12]|uniref:Glycosyl hydrolase 115 family protein n=1 Tax=Pelagicoccus enzymogenes TaxID=2773457 RepID=A0A927FC61_9BACT|nr:glycosyl hydrolase 115 family protein [Pelagicoccus enzymogenes]MBD5782417.1 glycosyl hydrolase 115 family protein [Pelagicoccus enzymogenes]